MEEEPKIEETTPAPKKHHSLRVRMRKFWYTVLEYTHLKDDTDYEATVRYISGSVDFRGVNLWVLAFAIIVASVGLNVNSTAVIIGAMLISPIMGPITGIGLSVGILDEELLKRSLRNLFIMVIISLLTSTLYFLISPLSEAQSELMARTRPTIFDVFIAFFGGLAGIVATSRKSQPFTVISGVAIATALMPPLCTAGYGLATWQLRYFGGAFYLFFINSFFIALATFIMVRFLDFPLVRYMDDSRFKSVRRMIYAFAILVMIPSVVIAINLVRESAFNSQAIKFVNEIQQTPYFENAQLIDHKREYTNKSQVITLRVIGKPLSNEDIAQIQSLMRTAYGLDHARLVVKQTEGMMDVTKQNQVIEDIIDKKDAVIERQDSTIVALRAELHKLTGSSENTVQLVKEIYSQHADIEQVAILSMDFYDTKTLEHKAVPAVYLKWKDGKRHPDAEKRLSDWLKVRLNVEEIRLIRMES
ncbi:MAG: DUF389 domain-containing protein [Bacteroidales bacterium]|nr:DUF389 domain-containing protein [Bacteroidales bacterium]